MLGWETFVTKRTLIISMTPISKKIIWVRKSCTLIIEEIWCFHKIYSGIYNQNIEKMLTLTVLYIECKSKNLSECLTNSYKENLKDICKK